MCTSVGRDSVKAPVTYLPSFTGLLWQVLQLTDRLTSASVTDTDQVDGVTYSGDQSLGVTGHPMQNKTNKAQRRRVSQ